MDLEQLQAALLAQQGQATLADDRYMQALNQQAQHEHNNQAAYGLGRPLRGIMNRFTKGRREDEYSSALQSAVDESSSVSDLKRQVAQYEAMLQEQAANAARFETEGLYQQYGTGRPEAALRARGQEIPDTPEATTLIKNLHAAGIDPRSPQGQKIIQQNLSKSQVSINTGLPKPQAGYVWNEDNTAQEPIPGTPQWQEAQELAESTKTGNEGKVWDAQIVVDTIDRVAGNIGPTTTGWGSLLKAMPESEALSMEGDLNTIMSNLAFDRLQKMRTDPANKTGGALGQVSERELALLQSTIASLDQKQSGENLKERLDIVRGSYQRFIDAINGDVPDDYVTKTVDGTEYIKVGDQWFPL